MLGESLAIRKLARPLEWVLISGRRGRLHATASRIRRHCFSHLHAGVGETLEIILTHRLYLGRSGLNAAEHRIDAQAGGGLAKKRTDGRHSIYEAFIEGKLEAPKHLARTVHDLYFEPKYEEFRPRTIWSLSNVFTSAFKDLDPIPQFKATAKLGEFLEARFSQSF